MNTNSVAQRPKKFRAAIVGAGYIADFHARAIQGLEGVELVSVCDANLRSAQSFAANWRVPMAFHSMDCMLKKDKPDSVHLLVPPGLHHSLAKAALQSGVHVFLEKPMCTSVEEADELLELARANGLCLGINHNFLYAAAYQRLREVVCGGVLGPIDYVSMNWFSELEQIRFGPFDSWMLRYPGNIVLEIGSHLVSALLDIMGPPDDVATVADRDVIVPGGAQVFRRWHIHTTKGRASADIRINLGPGFDEKTIHVHGLFGSATADFGADTCMVDQGTSLGVDFGRYGRNKSLARQIQSQARKTLSDYALSRLKLKRGGNPYQMTFLRSVASFYSGLRSDRALDARIDGRSGRTVVEWCNNIIRAAQLPTPGGPRSCQRSKPSAPSTVLVLGGSGFIGRELIHELVTAGYCVRVMTRGTGAVIEELGSNRLEIVRGDIRSEVDLNAALQGIQFVYHLAVGGGKTWDDYIRNEVEPARLVGKACLAAGITRLVYTGTIASYYAGFKADTITEQTPFARDSASRNYYARAKAASEAILLELHRTDRLPVVIFRPGIVIGRGGNPFHWGVGKFSEGVCEVWGGGNNKLPFVLVADVAAALVRGIQVAGIEGRSYNLIDVPLLTARDYLKELQHQAAIKLTVRYRPIWRFYLSDLAKWLVKLAVAHPDRIRIPSYFDWESRTQKATFDCTRARTELGWMPAGDRQRTIDEGIGGSLQSWLAAFR
jgi:predicted dehydrogenase/nucleoside-diphosphate-sugar epimerase